ncbi:MAG: hypothetical protein ACI9PZ_002510 [Parvicella sp.]|jgi:hypothetical protein
MTHPITQRFAIGITTALQMIISMTLLGYVGTTSALKVPSYTITYEVVVKKFVAGDLVIDVSEDDKGIVTIHGETFPNMFARTLGDGKVIEIIKYQKVNGSLRLQSVKEIKGKAQDQIRESVVNWKKKTITTNGQTTAFTPNTQMDAYTMPFLRVLGLDEASEDSETKVVSAKKAVDYIYESPTKESLEVNNKLYEANRYSKYRSNNKNKKISLWVSENTPVMPLKVEVSKKGKRHSWVTITDIKHN